MACSIEGDVYSVVGDVVVQVTLQHYAYTIHSKEMSLCNWQFPCGLYC